MKTLLIKIIEFYRLAISPWLGNNCRFHPSCSEYAQTAVEKKGIAQGALLAIKRIVKCQPFHSGGFDAVE